MDEDAVSSNGRIQHQIQFVVHVPRRAVVAALLQTKEHEASLK
jgi:hypothetical protein